MSAHAQGSLPGLIGPNAITRLAEAITDAGARRQAFRAAGLESHLTTPPQVMVPDVEVQRLHQALRLRFGVPQANRIGARAGWLTGQYLLANRIPSAVQRVLACLPERLALRLLLMAISRHAWTFTGAGVFNFEMSRPVRLKITGGPVSRGAHADEPVCAYYAATFETLFRAIVSPRIAVVETECEAMGAEACVFEVRRAA